MVSLFFLSISTGDFYKLFEDGLRKLIFLPSDFRVPLHAEREPIRARVNDRFDHAVRRARDYAQIAPDLVDGLMMRAVDARGGAAGEFGEQRTSFDPDVVRGPVKGLSLFVLD